MTWLSENWLPLLIGGGILLFMLRGRGMMGCGMGGHGSHGSTQHGSHGRDDGAKREAIDPVSREAVAGDGAISSVYRGRIYRFASRENRDQFEAAPERFATAQQVGDDQRRHRGC
ncbi:MAG: hypothetical protein ABT20_09205 [Rubrivivax sp. SCN 70-15]|nr:MAG: hypothetical protein ABT20_09205 [Rubrivivax sp. SCN 70-15]